MATNNQAADILGSEGHIHYIDDRPYESKWLSDGSSETHYEVRTGVCDCGETVEIKGTPVSHGEHFQSNNNHIDYTHDYSTYCYKHEDWCDLCDYKYSELVPHI